MATLTLILASTSLVAPYALAAAAWVVQSHRHPVLEQGEPTTAREECTVGVWDCPLWVTEAHAMR